jgi:hypothetical protein
LSRCHARAERAGPPGTGWKLAFLSASWRFRWYESSRLIPFLAEQDHRGVAVTMAAEPLRRGE